MNLALEKSMRILNDLASFCYYAGGDGFTMRLDLSAPPLTRLGLQCRIQNLPETKLKSMRKALALPRQHEVEQHYWELTGETESVGELYLVGAMSDEAQVEYEDGLLEISILRKD